MSVLALILADADRDYVVRRLIAKLIDLAMALLLFKNIGYIGWILGLLYLAVADGMFNGQSIGKKLVGLHVVIWREGSRPCTVGDSALRNISILIVMGISVIPVLNYVLLPIAALLIFGFETFLIFTDERRARVGDILAGSSVR